MVVYMIYDIRYLIFDTRFLILDTRHSTPDTYTTPLDTYTTLHYTPLQIMPALKEECQNSAKCAQLTKHFQHCEEKVNAGKGFKGEDCVEEL